MSEWIRPSDRMPEPGALVIVIEKMTDGKRWRCLRKSSDGIKFDGDGLLGPVLWWMPLPEMPEEED